MPPVRRFYRGDKYSDAGGYQLVNPSEYWAVNASRLLNNRFLAKDSVWLRIHNWLREMVQKIRGILGLRSDAPILKALGEVMDPKNFGVERGGNFMVDTVLANTSAMAEDGVLNNLASNTQARAEMPDAERRDAAPESTADTKAGDVIVTFNGRNMATAPRPENADKPSAWKAARDRVLSFLRKVYDDPVTVESRNGDKIIIAYSGIKHALNNGVPSLQESALALHIGEAINSAELESVSPDKKGREDPFAVTTYATHVKFDGVPHRATIYVRNHTDGNRYYDHATVEIGSPPGQSESLGAPNGRTSKPTPPFSGLDISLSEVDFKLKPTDSSPNFSLADDFDGTNPDAMFSRAPSPASNPAGAVMDALRGAGDISLPAGYLVNDFITSHGKLSWWDKSIGTMSNLAKRNPMFRPVYDAAQNFLNDVSTYATEAADQAPTLLPKLEKLRDLFKSPLSAADTKAISGPVFEGTLMWTRDDTGQPVPEPDPQKAGLVWSNAELCDRYGLTGDLQANGSWSGQIGLYHEARRAVNQSLTDLAISDMIRYAGKDVDAVARQARDSGDVRRARDILVDHMVDLLNTEPERAGVLLATITTLGDKAGHATDMMRKGYFPLSRFGHYTVDVTENGERVYFGMYETQAEANREARKLREAFPSAALKQGTMPESAYKMFAGVSPETVELFGQMLGLEPGGSEASSQAFQEYIKLAKNNKSAMKRLIMRKGVAGYSEDAGRVLAGFIYSNARQSAKNMHLGVLAKAVQDIREYKGEGELLDTAEALHNYVTNPTPEAPKLKALLFAQFLGGSVASALVNLTQPLMVTFPYLSQFGGAIKAAKQMKSALPDALKWASGKSTGDLALDAALKQAEEDGTLSPQEVHNLIAQAGGAGALRAGNGTKMGDVAAAGSNAMSRLMLVWGRPFSLAEQYNRQVSFIAAYRTAVEQGMPNPAKFAEKVVNETQFVYTKANRPAWARGAIGSTLFTFKTYSISYVELLVRMAKSGPEGKKAALIALGVMFLMSGLQGLPGADDLDDVIDGALQRMGYNFGSKTAKREFLAKYLGDGGARFMLHGISGLPGAPIDIGNRLGLGNLAPGTGMFVKKTDHTQDVAELFGPAGSMAKQWLQGADQLTQGNFGKALEAVLPVAAQNIYQGGKMAATGRYDDRAGRKVIDTDLVDAAFKAIGLQPNDVSRVQQATREVQQMISLNKMRETEIADLWAKGRIERDPEMVEKAKRQRDQWNLDNPTSKISIDPSQVNRRVQQAMMDKAKRIEKTAPREIRATVRQELAEAQQ